VGVGFVCEDPPDPHSLPVDVDVVNVVEQRQRRGLSPAWPGVRITASGRPAVLTARWSFGGQSSAGASKAFAVDGEGFDPVRTAPFPGTGRVLVRPHTRGVDADHERDVVLQRPERVVFDDHVLQDHIPSTVHLRSRSCAVFHGPYRSGRSRQGAPVRCFHRIALITCRWLRHRPPRRPLCAGSNGAILAQALSVS
jgi:hypothetical protein